MRKAVLLLVGLSVFIAAMPVVAQEKSSPPPPNRLQLVIEEVKPGKGAAHQQSEIAWLAAFQKTKVPAYGIAMTSMTGKSEAWFLNPMGKDWAEWEAWGKQMEADKAVQAELQQASAVDGELINSSRSLYLDYIPEISYRPEFSLGETRYFNVDIVRVKPGYGRAFQDIRKAINAAHAKANMDEHMIVYAVGAGGPGNTFIIFQPLKSIAALDSIEKLHSDNSEYQKTLGEEFQKMNREFAQTGLISAEGHMFSISPSMSWVGEDVAKTAPDFWNPKPALAKGKGKKGSSTTAAGN